MGNNSVAVRLSVEGAEQVRAALVKLGADGEAALKRLNFDVSPQGSGLKVLEAALGEGKDAAHEYAGALGGLEPLLSAAGGAWLGAGAAAGAFMLALEKGSAELSAHEKLLSTINGVLRATDAASGQTADSISAMAERISGSTLQTRDSVLQAATELLAFRNIGPEAFEPTLKLATDMSAVFGSDLATAAMQLGRAMDDPVNGMNALRRAGVDLSAAQKDLIRDLQESGNVAGAQSVLMQALTDKIGGAGSAQHDGLAGATHDLHEAWNLLLEDLARTTGAGNGANDAIGAVTRAVRALDSVIKGLDTAHLVELLAAAAALARGDVPSAVSAYQNATSHPASAPGFRAPGLEYPGTGSNAPTAANEAAMFGPQLARDRAVGQSVDALGQFNTALRQSADELRKSKLDQAIDKALDDAAAKIGTNRTALLSNPAYGAQVSNIEASATARFNAEQAEKDSAEALRKAHEAAAEAARKAAEAEKQLADARAKGWDEIGKLQTEALSRTNVPGAARLGAMQDAAARIPVTTGGDAFGVDVIGMTQATTAAQLGGEAFDNKTLTEQLDAGQKLVENFQNQTAALGLSKAAADAATFSHDALMAVFQKEGGVSAEAYEAILKEADAIKASGDAAKAASDEFNRNAELTTDLRDGLGKLALDGTTNFRNLGDAARQFGLELIKDIENLEVIQPLLNMLLGDKGTAGQGVLGSLFSGASGLFGSLFGGGSSMIQPLTSFAPIPLSIAPSIPSISFADGGIMTSRGSVPLRRYEGGGVADSPQMALYGEGRSPEAYVPLPDGRSIPVNLHARMPRSGTSAPNFSVTNHISLAGANGDMQIAQLVSRAVAEGNRQTMKSVRETLPSMMEDVQLRGK